MANSLLISMGVSIDGYISDRDGNFGWGRPSDELFAFHVSRIGEFGAIICGRRLYETMLPWELEPAMRNTELDIKFADLWSALPKVVFSRTLTTVEGNARLAQGSLAEEIGAVMSSTDKDVEIGGADLAGQAFELGLVDQLQMFRSPIVLGGGTPLLPPVTQSVEFELVETRRFDEVVYECYRRTQNPAATS